MNGPSIGVQCADTRHCRVRFAYRQAFKHFKVFAFDLTFNALVKEFITAADTGT
jgi:hypothetical protein